MATLQALRLFSLFQELQVTDRRHFRVKVPQVHAVAAAKIPPLTMNTGAALFPLQVSHDPVSVLPDILEPALPDIPLDELLRQIRTCSDVAVTQDAGDVNTSRAIIQTAPHLTFIPDAQEPFLLEARLEASLFLSTLLDKAQKRSQLGRPQPEHRVFPCPADGDDRQQPPLVDLQVAQQLIERRKLADVILAYAGGRLNDAEISGLLKKLQGVYGLLKGNALPHKFMGLLQAVQANRDRGHPGLPAFFYHVRINEHAVRDHAPVEPQVVGIAHDFKKVRSHQRLAAGGGNGDGPGVKILRDGL